MRRIASAFLVTSWFVVGACGKFNTANDGTNDVDGQAPTGDASEANIADAGDAGEAGKAAPISGAPYAAAFNGKASLTDGFDDRTANDPSGGPLSFMVVAQPDEPGPSLADCSDEKVCSEQVVAFGYAGNPGLGAFLQAPLGGQFQHVRLDFDAAFALNTTGQEKHTGAQFAGIELTNKRFVFVEIYDSQLELGDQYQTSPDDATAYTTNVFTFGALDTNWSEYQLYVDLANGVAVVAVNQQVAAAISLDDTVKQQMFLTARVGLSYSLGGLEAEEDVDNVGLTQY